MLVTLLTALMLRLGTPCDEQHRWESLLLSLPMVVQSLNISAVSSVTSIHGRSTKHILVDTAPRLPPILGTLKTLCMNPPYASSKSLSQELKNHDIVSLKMRLEIRQ